MAQITSIHPHEVGRDLIPELATRVYSSQLDSFREAISNAFDEGSKQVALSIAKNRIMIEDWGGGIKDYDQFRKFGQASKKSRTGEVIGEKGLGKLSLLNLGSTVLFETNNGVSGMSFYMTLAGFSTPEYGDMPDAFVPHKGTRITITKLASTADIGEISPYLRKAFGLRLVRGARITINSEPLKPRFAHDPRESVLLNLPQCGADVTGNIASIEEGKGMVDVYIDHVFVASMEVDTTRRFGGWINCNALTPETSRNNIIQNQIYKEFAIHLRRYASRFPFRETGIDARNLMLSRELNTLLKSYLKDMKVSVRSGLSIAASSSSSATRNQKSEKSTVVAKASNGVAQSLEKTPSSSSSKESSGKVRVRWQYADLGNEKEPIYFVPPNTVYCNTSSDLYRFAVTKSRSFGPTWIRLLPYLSRIAVSMTTSAGSSSKLRPDEFNLKVDQATRYFLQQKGIIN
ncbi:MAG TPA: ATP-binding protein [Nitrososphaera sp.]|nr:ATP-binding protein [Nitrososphaera sp.]